MPDVTETINQLKSAFENNLQIDIAKYTTQLGDYYLDQIANLPDSLNKQHLYCYAAIAYNSAHVRYKKQGCTDLVEEIIQKLADLKLKFLADLRINLEGKHLKRLNQIFQQIKKERTRLFQKQRQELQIIEGCISTSAIKSLDGINRIKDLFIENFNLYKHILEKLTSTIFEIIGPPPCDYAFVVVGSLGKLMPSSHSDLDAMILIENERDKLFFQSYAIFLSLLIIDIGETSLIAIKTPEMKWINQFCEKEIEGFSIDFGGVPIQFGPHQLLASPEELCKIIVDIQKDSFPHINTLTYCPRLLLGENRLLEQFNDLNSQRLQKESLATKKQRLEFCLENFNSILDDEMYMKHEWYRQFSEGLLSLARIYSIPSTNPCDIITFLVTHEIINLDLAQDLHHLYFLVSYFVLRNYLTHQARMQQILIQSQIIPCDAFITVSPGHKVKTAYGSFQNEVIVHRMIAFDDERYYLKRNKQVISESMPIIHYLLYLQNGYRKFLSYFLTEEYSKIYHLQSLAMDPKVLFDYSARANHLSKNSFSMEKYKTNQLYFHLTDYYDRLMFKEYIENRDGDSACLFLSSGIALISLALKLSHIEVARRIADNIFDFLSCFKIDPPSDSIDKLLAFDKRLPTLYTQFLFFLSRIYLFVTTPEENIAETTLQQVSANIETAEMIRRNIDLNRASDLFDDFYNDGSDDILISLYGPNLALIASGKTVELKKALESYKAYLGHRDEFTDLMCYLKIIKINFSLYDNASLAEKTPLFSVITTACQKGIKIAHKLNSSLIADFYLSLATILRYQEKSEEAVFWYQQCIAIEYQLDRKNGLIAQKANLGLSFFDTTATNSMALEQQPIPK